LKRGNCVLAIVAICFALLASVLLAAAQPANEPVVAGKNKNRDLVAYEIDEIAEGLEDAETQVPTHDGFQRPTGSGSRTPSIRRSLT